MTQTSLSLILPTTLKLTVTHEQFIDLAIANRELRIERTIYRGINRYASYS